VKRPGQTTRQFSIALVCLGLLATLALARYAGSARGTTTAPNSPTVAPSAALLATPAVGASEASPLAVPAAIAATTSTHLPMVTAGPAQAASVGWPQLAGGPQRTGYAPIQLQGPFQFRWVWNGPAGGGDAGPAADHLALPKGVQPVIGDGRMYIGHRDGKLRAINTANGQVAWTATVGGEVLGTAAYHAGLKRVFVGSTNGQIFSVNAATGAIVGSFDGGGPIEMSPLVVGDVVYIGTVIGKGQNNGEQTSGMLYALNAADLKERWRYNPGAGLLGSAAYSAKQSGLVIILAEDKSVHAVRAANGERLWRQVVNAGRDPQRQWVAFPETYPAVSEANNVVVIRSYFMWQRTWAPDRGATDTLAEIRSFLASNPEFQSFFVLDLATGAARYVAPVLGGGIGNNDDYYSTPPQAVIRPLPGGEEVAYLNWRSSQACLSPSNCDSREEGAVGEMNLGTGDIRFINVDKNAWQWRMPTDEMGALTMAGDTLFYSHWMSMAAVRITDRSAGRGASAGNPIQAEKAVGVVNSLGVGNCNTRVSARHYCPTSHYEYNGGNVLEPGFYTYYVNDKIYDRFFTPPVFGVAIDETGVIYWKSVDGAIIALAASNATPAPSPAASPSAAPSAAPQPSPSSTTVVRPFELGLPLVRG